MAMAPVAPRYTIPVLAQNTPDVSLSEALLRQAGGESKAPLLNMFLENAKSADMNHAKTAVINMAAVLDDPNLDVEAAKSFYREHADEIITTVQAVLKHVLEGALPDLSAIFAALHVLRFGLQLDSATAKKFATAIFGALLTFGTGGSPLLVYLLVKAAKVGADEIDRLVDEFKNNVSLKDLSESLVNVASEQPTAVRATFKKLIVIAQSDEQANESAARFLRFIPNSTVLLLLLKIADLEDYLGAIDPHQSYSSNDVILRFSYQYPIGRAGVSATALAGNNTAPDVDGPLHFQFQLGYTGRASLQGTTPYTAEGGLYIGAANGKALSGSNHGTNLHLQLGFYLLAHMALDYGLSIYGGSGFGAHHFMKRRIADEKKEDVTMFGITPMFGMAYHLVGDSFVGAGLDFPFGWSDEQKEIKSERHITQKVDVGYTGGTSHLPVPQVKLFIEQHF